jgi:hypothetical protein
MTDREIMEAALRGERFENEAGQELRLGSDGMLRIFNVMKTRGVFAPGWRIKPRLTWDQALAAMREGKKVRREVWLAGSFLFIRDGVFRRKVAQQGVDDAVFTITDFDAPDWEVVE